MKLALRKRKRHEDSAALSDLAFLLIIYFIVIAGFTINKGFLMNLPEKDSSRFVLKEDLLRFELNGEGGLVYEGRASSRSEAEGIIRAAISTHPNLALVLTVNPASPWQEVVSFVELAQALEAETFSFTMKEQGEDKAGTSP